MQAVNCEIYEHLKHSFMMHGIFDYQKALLCFK